MQPTPPSFTSLSTSLIQISSLPSQLHLPEPFPLILSPIHTPLNHLQLQEYFQAHHKTILQAVSYHGAVLFTDFDIQSPIEWASILYKSGLKEMPYIGGAAVRRLIVGSENRLLNPQIVTTNESPPSQVIPFHHELAQTPDPCSHISFYCLENTTIEGGSTPLLRSDLVYDWLKRTYPSLLEEFESFGVKYVRVVPEIDDPESAIGRSWKSMFNVQTRQEAEESMKAKEWAWEWFENGDCKTTSKVLPATIVNSKGTKSFFNQVVAAYTGWIDKRNDPKKAVLLGNGQALPEKPMEDLVAFMDKMQCIFTWKPGQFAIVDNTMTYHARQSFSGGRRQVMASIFKGTKDVLTGMTHLTLNSGDSMPSIGLGCWKIPRQDTCNLVYNAIKIGYRCIDEACDYGNELECGLGIQKALEEGLVKREELWVTSKLWNTYHRKEHVRAACLRSLKDLGLEYLDLYLIHFPIAQKFVPFETRYPPEWFFDPEAHDKRMEEDQVSIRETWEAMEELVKEGLVRNIGVSNFNVQLLRELLSYSTIKPSVLQVELHPYNTQEKLIRFCRKKGIVVTGYSPLGSGSYVELGGAKEQDSVLSNEKIKGIAEKYKKSSAQVVLRWGVQRGVSLVVKSNKQERLKENLEVFDFYLTGEEMEIIGMNNQNRRFNDPGVFCEGAFNSFVPIYE